MRQYYAPDFEVKIQGLFLEADVKNAVISLSYDNHLEQASMVQLTLNNADLRLADTPLFNIGNEIEVHMGYVGNLQPMMLGEIAGMQPSFPEGGASTITVNAYDKSHRMRHNHKIRYFEFSNASAIAAQIATENYLIPVITPSPTPFKRKFQDGSDMALLQQLARRNYFETFVHWDRLYFRPRVPQTEAVTLEWGKNLSSFNPRLSTSGQAGIVALQDYDQDLAQTIAEIVPVTASETNLEAVLERLGSTFLDQLKSYGVKYFTGESVESYFDARSFAKALLEEILEGMFEANGSCIGIPELRAGDMIDVRGVGKRFSGRYRLRQVNHSISSSGYRTTFEVTQRSSSSMAQVLRRIFEEISPPDKQNKRYGTVLAVVENNIDPEEMGRVLVRFPWLGTQTRVWAKVMQSAPSDYSLPHIGQRVWVTFDRGDLERPFVIGTTWDQKTKPLEKATPGNPIRHIQSPAGHKITLDDSKGKERILLESAAGARIEMDEKGGISLISAGEAKIKLDGISKRIDLNP